MTLVPPSTNNVYICQFPPTLTRWTGHVTVPIRKKKCHAIQGFPRTMALCSWQMCSLDSWSVRFWVLRFILFALVVDNCTLWYLFQEDHISYINHCTVQPWRPL